jgi:3-methyladenine DNA glycosylase AlkD
MTAAQVLAELKPLGSESIRKILPRHGIVEPVLGVKIEELKKFQKRIGKNHQLSLDLYDTGVYEAMYLAGLVADESTMTRANLQHWVQSAKSAATCGSIVAGVAAESAHGWELALEWIASAKPTVAITGWATLAGLASIKADGDLDVPALKKLLHRVARSIHQQTDRVRYAMNSFVISVGTHVAPLKDAALQAAKKIGVVSVDMGETSCKVPRAAEVIHKAQANGKIGKKRKTAKC